MTVEIPMDALDWALAHVKLHSAWESFPAPFEYEAIGINWNALRKTLSRQASNWAIRCQRTGLAPKHQFGFRQVTQLDPLDSIVLAALTFLVGSDLEKSRVSEDKALWFRFSPDEQGRLYKAAGSARRLFNKVCTERAQTSSTTHVVQADIADFYPGVYFHRVEEVVLSATPTWAAKLLVRLLKELNDYVSASLPVGPSFVHLLANAALTPLDEHLIAEGHEFVRLGDDFCFFCNSRRDAWKALTTMANFLYSQYRLFLQPGKTRILDKASFIEDVTASPAAQEMTRLEDLVEKYAPELDLIDDYTGLALEVNQIDDTALEHLRELEWVEFLRKEIESGFFSLSRVRYVLSRARLFGVDQAASLVLNNLELLAVVTREITNFLSALSLDIPQQKAVCTQLLRATEDGRLGNTDYELLWLAHFLFAVGDLNMGNEAELLGFWRRYRSNRLVEREFLIGCAPRSYIHVVKSYKPLFRSLDPWSRRALLRACHCLDQDERRAWTKGIRRNLDSLEKAVLTAGNDH